MKVGWLHEHLLLWDGGIRYVYELARRLAREADVALYTVDSLPDVARRFEEAGVNVVQVPLLSANRLGFWLTLPHQMNSRRSKLGQALDSCDVVVSSSFPMNYVATACHPTTIGVYFEPPAFLYDIDYIGGLPLVQRIVARLGGCLARKYDIAAARRATEMVTITHFAADSGERTYGRIAHVLYPGVDTTIFGRRHDGGLRERYANHSVILHSASYFTPVKGTHFLIKALPLIAEKVPDARLLILNCKRNDRVKARLVSQALRLGVLDRIEFLPFIQEELLPSYYSVAKVVVQPSINESFRLSLQEGAACEVPGVCFTGGSAEEDIADGVTGLIVPFGNIAGLSGAVAKVLTDDDRRETMGKAARERVQRQFNWDVSAGTLCRLVRQLVAT